MSKQVRCSCCGKLYQDNNPKIEGDKCEDCQEWSEQLFYNSRIEAVKDQLDNQRTEQFSKLSYAKKVMMVNKLIQEGVII